MQIAILLIGTLLTLTLVAQPYFTMGLRRAKRQEQERWLMTRLRIVRRCYPELQKYSYSEITERYNIDELFQNVGRREILQMKYEREIL